MLALRNSPSPSRRIYLCPEDDPHRLSDWKSLLGPPKPVEFHPPSSSLSLSLYLAAREHTVPDENRQQDKNNRLRPGQEVRPGQKAAGAVRNPGIRRPGSRQLRRDRVRHRHVVRGGHLLRAVSTRGYYEPGRFTKAS